MEGVINLKGSERIGLLNWAMMAIYGLLLAGIYYSTLQYLILHDWARDDFTHGYLIPFVIVYLLWEKRNDLASVRSVASWNGIIPLGFGLSLFWLGELGGEYLTLYISLWFVLFGLSLIHLGWKKIKTIGFAFILFPTMFPLPGFLYQKVSLTLQLISSYLGVAMMQVYGMSVHREGNVIDLGFTQLQVVDACSGLRYLIPLIVLSIILAYFFKAAFWKKAVLVISSLPLSIFVNSLRIALTGILYETLGERVAQGFFHGFSGWFIFVFSFGVLLFEMWIFKKLWLGSLGSFGSFRWFGWLGSLRLFGWFRSFGTSGEAVFEPETKRGTAAFFCPPQFIAVVLLLGMTWALSAGIEFREKVPIKKPFFEFPLQVGPLTGARDFMEQRFIETLDLDDYLIIDYRDAKGRDVNLYVAYYESQRKGESIHSPATCLPGSGWIFKEAGPVSIPVQSGGDRSMRVNRAFMQSSGYKQLVYYWFPQRGRILTNAYQLKLYAFWDALTKQRTDGALVRLITPVYEFEEPKEAEARLQGFVKEIVPVLSEFIPE